MPALSRVSKLFAYLLLVIILVLAVIIRIMTLGVGVPLPRLDHRQHGYYDYEGLIHWHTRYSGDASGTYEKAARLGNQNGLDFLITTEHNNLKALQDHKEGWHGQMLILVGVESTRREGYLLGINLQTYTTRHSPTDQFLAEVAGQGGFALVAHPKSPRWSWRGSIDPRIAGQEIIDLTDQFATASPMAIATGLLYYPFNTPAAYMQVYARPVEALKMWDEQTRQRRFIGIYAPDVHQLLRLMGKPLARFPKAEDVMPIAHNHVILPVAFSGDFAKDKAMLLEALEEGRLYVSIDMLQDATGFFFSARQDKRIAWMGDALPAHLKTDFLVQLPKTTLKHVVVCWYHNGQPIARQVNAPYIFQAAEAGAYRVEVQVQIPTFWGFKRNVVWIYSNPIYLR